MNTVTINVASVDIEIPRDAAIKLGRALLTAAGVKPEAEQGWRYLSDGQPDEAGWYDVLYRWEPVEEWKMRGMTRMYWDGSSWLYCEGGCKVAFGNEDTEGERYRRSA